MGWFSNIVNGAFDGANNIVDKVFGSTPVSDAQKKRAEQWKQDKLAGKPTPTVTDTLKELPQIPWMWFNHDVLGNTTNPSGSPPADSGGSSQMAGYAVLLLFVALILSIFKK